MRHSGTDEFGIRATTLHLVAPPTRNTNVVDGVGTTTAQGNGVVYAIGTAQPTIETPAANRRRQRSNFCQRKMFSEAARLSSLAGDVRGLLQSDLARVRQSIAFRT